MNEKYKYEIEMNIIVRSKIPETTEERDDAEFSSEKGSASRKRQCDVVLGRSKIIPSRLHDKSLQKME